MSERAQNWLGGDAHFGVLLLPLERMMQKLSVRRPNLFSYFIFENCHDLQIQLQSEHKNIFAAAVNWKETFALDGEFPAFHNYFFLYPTGRLSSACIHDTMDRHLCVCVWEKELLSLNSRPYIFLYLRIVYVYNINQWTAKADGSRCRIRRKEENEWMNNSCVCLTRCVFGLWQLRRQFQLAFVVGVFPINYFTEWNTREIPVCLLRSPLKYKIYTRTLKSRNG